MSAWKVLSPQRREKLNYSAMMFVTKEAKKWYFLNFTRYEPLCSEAVSFTVEARDGVTGNVTLANKTNYPNLVCATSKFVNFFIQSNLYKVEMRIEPWRRLIAENTYLTRGIPNTIVEMAVNPVTMDAVFE